jgi:hypothetical protein
MLCFLHNSATEVSALRPSITIKIFCSAVKILRVFLRMSFTNDSVLFFFDVPIIKSNVFDENTPLVFKISCPLFADDLHEKLFSTRKTAFLLSKRRLGTSSFDLHSFLLNFTSVCYKYVTEIRACLRKKNYGNRKRKNL